MSESVECPYCKEYVDIEPDEHYEDFEEYECSKCNKNFEVFAEVDIRYSVYGKADCLNGGEHKWKEQVGVPEIHFRGKYLCEDCSATHTKSEELATKAEWDIYFKRSE